MNVFEFEDYRRFLHALASGKQRGRGYKAALAEAAGCQRSVFSQVLREKMHLSRDHLAELARFLGLPPDEEEYFVLLLDLSRAHSKRLEAMIRRRLGELRAKHARPRSRLNEAKITEPAHQTLYYSSWYFSAVHLLASIPAYQTPAAMARRLELPVLVIQQALASLKEMGLTKQKGEKWIPTQKSIHLPIGSPLNEMNHAHWRLRALQSVQKQSDESIHYSLVCSMSKADAEKLREELMRHILKERDRIAPSPEEELYCISHDFFPV